ncbi:MAG: hypothetical protein ACYC7E_15260 [Armatimonadota bacterium]
MSTATSSMLTSLRQLLRGEKPDCIVWTADITYWLTGQVQAGTADPAWQTEEGFLALHKELGILPYYYYESFDAFRAVVLPPVELRVEQQGTSTISRYLTPLGELTEVRTYLAESACAGITKYFVETERDLDILRFVLEHRRLVPDHLEDYVERMALWAQYDGLPSLGLPHSPLSSFFVEWAGVENGAYLVIDCDVAVREALTMMQALEDPVLNALCALRPPLVHFPDNLSSENFAGFYDAWMAPTHRWRLERLHAAGVPVAVHLDGTVRGLLPKLAAIGFDSVEALTPQPVGDVALAEMRALAGSDSLILWGGAPGAMFAPPYTWADMERHIEELLACWGGTPFIIGVADQVPPDGDITFCTRIAEMIAR